MNVLPKGGRFKFDNNIKKILIGIDWKLKKEIKNIFIDSNCLLLNNQDILTDENKFIYYDNPNYKEQVIYNMENLDYKEEFILDLSNLDKNIEKLVFLLNIYKANENNYTFDNLENIKITIKDFETKNKILEFILEDKDLSIERSLNIGELYKKEGSWRFKAVGMGQKEGLIEFIKQYQLL